MANRPTWEAHRKEDLPRIKLCGGMALEQDGLGIFSLRGQPTGNWIDQKPPWTQVRAPPQKKNFCSLQMRPVHDRLEGHPRSGDEEAHGNGWKQRELHQALQEVKVRRFTCTLSTLQHRAQERSQMPKGALPCVR